MMSLHAGEDIAKEIKSQQNMRAFVEHHALGSSGHGGISHFGSGRQTAVEILTIFGLDRTSVRLFACKFVKQGQKGVERSERVGFQAAKGTECERDKVFLQFANVAPTKADIMGEISCAFEVPQIHVIQFLAKMLLRLQHLEPDGLEACDDRLDFKDEVLAHKNADEKLLSLIRSDDDRIVTMS